MAKSMHSAFMIDGRNFLDKEALEAVGFQYYGIGH
jgi:UDPglucose 6-dehydrogenase